MKHYLKIPFYRYSLCFEGNFTVLRKLFLDFYRISHDHILRVGSDVKRIKNKDLWNQSKLLGCLFAFSGTSGAGVVSLPPSNGLNDTILQPN